MGLERVRPLIGTGGDKLLSMFGLQPDSDLARAISKTKRSIFNEKHVPELRGFPAVPALMARLLALGLRLAVASSARGAALERLLGIAGALQYLPVESSVGGRSKPDPDIVEGAVKWLGLQPAQCIMVGDAPFDAVASARARVPFIGLRCGGRQDRELKPSIAIFDDPEDLLQNLDSVLPPEGAR
jgi:phosphoglycolate phosphatase-like HAD superfamily hydrolase